MRRSVAALLVAVLLSALGLSVARADENEDALLPGGGAIPRTIADSRIEERSIYSEALDRTMTYYVFLPPWYDATDRRYPTMYMLHGMGGSKDEWLGYGLGVATDVMVRKGEIEPVIVVMPEGHQSYWFDHASGANYGEYVAREIVADVDATYRTIRAREARAVGGLSMGATGALGLAITYPETFAVVGAHGTPLRGYPAMVEYLGDEMAARWLGSEARYARFNPLWLYPAHPAIARRLTIHIDVGADDHWRPINELFSQALDAADIGHQFSIWPGDHDGDRYWRPRMGDIVRVYARAFADVPITLGHGRAFSAAI